MPQLARFRLVLPDLRGLGGQAALRRLLPQAAFHALSGRGHNTHWEVPREVAALIAGFLAAPAPARPARPAPAHAARNAIA